MEITVQADELVSRLKAFKRLPKQLTVKVKGEYTTRTNNYALINLKGGDVSVIVPYETFRKTMESLPKRRVSVTLTSEGINIRHNTGHVYLRHLGAVDDVKEICLASGEGYVNFWNLMVGNRRWELLHTKLVL